MEESDAIALFQAVNGLRKRDEELLFEVGKLVVQGVSYAVSAAMAARR